MLDGGAQRALARRQIVRTLHQQIETPILQVRQQLGRREQIDLRGTQFQRQRQAIQPLANRSQGWLVLGREAKVGIHRLGALDKQFDGGREIERRHLEALLGAQMQPFATGGQDTQPWAFRQQLGDQRRAIANLFEVIQHQQHGFVAQALDQLGFRRFGAGIATAHAGGDRGRHQHGIADRGQRNKGRPVRIVILQVGCHGQCQLRLANARRPHQRQQAPTVPWQALTQLPHFLGAPDQVRRCRWQVRCAFAARFRHDDLRFALARDRDWGAFPARAGGQFDQPGGQVRLVLQAQGRDKHLEHGVDIRQAAVLFQNRDKRDAVAHCRRQVALGHTGALAYLFEQVAKRRGVGLGHSGSPAQHCSEIHAQLVLWNFCTKKRFYPAAPFG